MQHADRALSGGMAWQRLLSELHVAAMLVRGAALPGSINVQTLPHTASKKYRQMGMYAVVPTARGYVRCGTSSPQPARRPDPAFPSFLIEFSAQDYPKLLK